MSDMLAVIAGKLSAKAIKAVGAGLGSNLPGRVSLAVSSGVLANLAKQSRLGVLAVSGTNGKSTTCGFISAILEHSGFKIAHNRQGANLVPGIAASLVNAAAWDGRLDADYCLFEIDEAALPLVAKEVPISAIVVTNLFRDQLDRFGELDTTANLINKGINTNHSRAVLNADDPNVAKLGSDSSKLFYGIGSLSTLCGSQSENSHESAPSVARELAYCAKCGSEYSYSRLFYGQLGHYACLSCGTERPSPAVVAEDVEVGAGGSSFNLRYGDHSIAIEIALPGLFNVYNALAAAALAIEVGIDLDRIKYGLASYSTLFGRSERLHINGKTVLIQLIKNPAGASQAIRAAVNDPKARILVAINDNYADGRDVSWLWDAEFELLANHAKDVFVSGIRAYDMSVRLKYAGLDVQRIKVVTALDQALREAIDAVETDETLWILPTYTCLLELQKIAKNMGISLAGT